MHIVIAGGGEIGGQIAKALTQKHDIVVIDKDPELRERLEQHDVQFLEGSATDPDTLREAKMDLADVFIAATNWDEVNLLACLLAKGLGAKEVICFVGKSSYMDILTDPRTVEILGTRIDRVLWPQRSLAKEIVEVIMVPGAVDVETLAGGRLRFLEYRVEEKSPYAHRHLKIIDWPEETFMAGVLREGRLIAARDPGFDDLELQPGDRILFTSTPMGFTALQACFAPRGRVRQVMIVGGGNVGYMVAQELSRYRVQIVVVDHNEERCAWLAEELPGALVLQGDGTDTDLLESEGLDNTDVLVAVTDNDEKNLLVSLFAKQAGVAKVITRVGRAENRKLFERVGIDIPLTPRQAAVREVVDWLDSENVDHLSLMEENIELLEIELPSTFRERTLGSLELPTGATVVAVERGKKVSLPNYNQTVAAGDTLLVLSERRVAEDVLARVR
ncbi:TrkA-N domain protein [Allomeiothermus silvanus DSM 9946]|uniref:Trk system potassium uptake protein TrkA n=1 Tax=Allomeiothermus silvanus (strain ATCC 700542 / DSM 9946 / NBRC 106475 / NCIMB 13440 / VI-R2) TaxID=526227 RepID=D7BBC2_ALLS1|nr:Trk system potassium transporter TrkA [Allomeiothermus silvanus]ADH62682.1 TrkA-N domain protein [Allomeiothermus silvanus DSM 9946]